MAGNLIIVAIPDESDRVWKVSSEKVPHLTLLFLGEDADQIPNLEQIVLFTEHAANTTLRRFYLPVDHRGKLGEGEADVLFFKKDRYDFKAVRDFRATLLQDTNIKKAYDTTSQFETPEYVGAPGQPWIPHLTLGYPGSLAKPEPNDQLGGFYNVEFTKIAIWTGDYEGPEFLLKDYWEDFDMGEIPMDVAMSEIAHYGTKGMRWGVRNEKGGSNTSGVGEKKREGLQGFLDPQGHDVGLDVVKTAVWGYLVPVLAPFSWPAQVRLIRGGARGVKAKAVDRQEKKFEENAMSPKNFAAIHNGAQEKINRDIHLINKKYPDLSKPATKKKYDDEVLKAVQEGYRTSANSIGSKPGTQHLDVEFKNDGMDFTIHAREGASTPLPRRVTHAAEDVGDEEITVEITGKIKRDPTGHIVGFEFDHLKPRTVEHIAELGEEFLSHYGVKGMQWGVRRERAVTTQTHIDTGLRKRKTKVQAKGGEAHPAHGDAIKAAVAKQKLKKSGTDALSTQELRDLANRLQVENQVQLLTSSKGKQFVSRQFETETKNLARTGFQTGVSKVGPRVIKRAGRAAATGATTAALVL